MSFRRAFQVCSETATRLIGSLHRARRLPGAGEIEELKDAPGGGYRITFHDPEGFPVNLVFGQGPAETGKLPTKLVFNFENEKEREGAFQRFRDGPAAVHKVSPDSFPVLWWRRNKRNRSR